MSVTWTIECDVPAGAADAFEAAVEPFCEALGANEAPGRRGVWRLVGYAPVAPDYAALTAAVQVAALALGVPAPDVRVLPLSPRDWLAENRRAFPPIRAGRYFVYGEYFEGAPPAGAAPICLDAGPAFGSGTHETTRGCLLALDRLAAWPGVRRVLDLGGGSGILAIAAARTWPGATVVATDIDPVATRTAAENARRNAVHGRLRCLTADGLKGLPRGYGRPGYGGRHDGAHDRAHDRAQGRGYDLIFANILAGPLMRMAGGIVRLLAPGGVLVLSGLLAEQEAQVDAVYRARGGRLGLRALPPLRLGEWVVLRYRRGEAAGA